MEAMIFGFCLVTSDINIFLLLSYKTYKKSLLAAAFSLLSLVLTGITVKKKTELRDRIAKVLERREAEPPALPEETAKLYDGALFLFAEAAKALWPRMDIRPIERAAVFETWDEREKYTKLAARIIGNAVIDKPEDLTYFLDPERLAELWKGRTPQE